MESWATSLKQAGIASAVFPLPELLANKGDLKELRLGAAKCGGRRAVRGTRRVANGQLPEPRGGAERDHRGRVLDSGPATRIRCS